MLHEILLSLSGYSSPLLQRTSKDEHAQGGETDFLQLSPPERALLTKLAYLSDLHILVKRSTEEISSTHTSVICRTVSSTIASKHLKQFRQRVLEVESSILSKDARFVGGYDIVPLSKVVGEFAPWTRRLEWLRDVVQFMLPPKEQGKSSKAAGCSGPAVIDFLRHELHTGYEDLQEMAHSLLDVAEMCWLRQLSTWLLYGKLSSFGARDFFVRADETRHAASPTVSEFLLDSNLVPGFVSPATVQSILFIGRSLNQIRSQMPATAPDPVVGMIPTHLDYLKSLTSPINTLALSSVLSAIRISVSQNALSQLLPLPRVLGVLEVLHDFLLLGRGEFTASLVHHADERLRKRHHSLDPRQPLRKAGRLDDIMLKDGEVAEVLKQTFDELSMLQVDNYLSDDTMDAGRQLLRFSVDKTPPHIEHNPAIAFRSFLFPTSIILTLSLPTHSPLKLFLSAAHLRAYSVIHGYLLSIRRADIHLSSLWKSTSLRRSHPCPLGPPLSSTRAGGAKLATQRRREDVRAREMRRYWATATKALLVVSELGSYFQGEVIKNHWEHLQNWIHSFQSSGGRTSSARGSRPDTASSAREAETLRASHNTFGTSHSSQELNDGHQMPNRNDPATLAQAHQSFIHSLTAALLLTNAGFVAILRELLNHVDHFVALFERLLPIRRGLDLQEDEGVVDTLANYAADEKDVVSEMERSRILLERSLMDLVEKVRDVDEQRGIDDLNIQLTTEAFDEVGFGEAAYAPWRGRTIDRLTMRLECLAAEVSVEHGQHEEEMNYETV
jgi:hypothetical protein